MQNKTGVARENAGVVGEERLLRLAEWNKLLDELLAPVLAKKAGKVIVDGTAGV